MIVFPFMLIGAAKSANIPTPEIIENDEYIDAFKESHPRFFVFCVLQLGRAVIAHGEHWENAKIIARFTDEQIKTMTLKDFREAGFQGI